MCAYAVPRYVGGCFNEAPPGHRFRLYFRKALNGGEKVEAAKDCALKLPEPVRRQLEAVRRRQLWLAGRADALELCAESTASFVTGIGMAHPLENGFAFLDPYGLPYLPGSALKGSLRRAAEELALLSRPDEACGWSLAAVWWLFGFDGSAAYLEHEDQTNVWWAAYRSEGGRDPELLAELMKRVLPVEQRELTPSAFQRDLCGRNSSLRRSIHFAGALSFWDALPDCSEGMRVEIMNPHFREYYQGTEAPHDGASPVPIYFLSVPEGTPFAFRVSGRDGLPPGLRDRWHTLIEAAFDHVLRWHGLGAKTGTGMGQMQRDHEAERKVHEERARTAQRAAEAQAQRLAAAEEEAEERARAAMSEIDRLCHDLDRTNDENRVHEAYKKLSGLARDEQLKLARALKQAYSNLKKWPGTSDKQRAKTTEIRKVLGEA